MFYMPASIYDKLEQRANELGGIGRGEWRRIRDDVDPHGYWGLDQEDQLEASCPMCVNGIWDEIRGEPFARSWTQPGIPSAIDNDRTVERWLLGNNLPLNARVPWNEYVKAMGIIRIVEGCENA
jgi:hypothetical protein